MVTARFTKCVRFYHAGGNSSARQFIASQIWYMPTMNYELVIALASLAISVAALWVAQSSLLQAKRVADRDHEDWKQRKWFDLYLKADEIYDLLECFQAQYDGTTPPTIAETTDWNNFLLRLRQLHATAVVFPKNAATDKLFSSTAVFKNRAEAFSKNRLAHIFDAAEELRQKALVNPTILG